MWSFRRKNNLNEEIDRVSKLVISKIHSKRVAKQFIMEELDAASNGDDKAKMFVSQSGFETNEYKGAMRNSFDEVDGPNGPQQELLRECMLFEDKNIMVQVRIGVVTKIIDMYQKEMFKDTNNFFGFRLPDDELQKILDSLNYDDEVINDLLLQFKDIIPDIVMGNLSYNTIQRANEFSEHMSMAASKGNDIAVTFCAFINNEGIFEEFLPVPLAQMSDKSLDYLILLLDKFGAQQKSKSIKKLLHKSRTEVESLAEDGNVYMQYLMGYWYSFDDSETKGELNCLKDRLFWYEKAAQQDFHLAIKYVASFFDNQPGFKTDYKKAAYWYRKGALNNLALPAYNLALMYNSGEGVQKNNKVAGLWASHAYALEENPELKNRILESTKSLGININENYNLGLDPELDTNSAELNNIY